MLLMVGEVDSAERALTEIMRAGTSDDVNNNALIELMHCASYRRDRVAFERWRRQCEARRGDMPPNIVTDFMLKLGIGRARFGQYKRAREALAGALRVAQDAGLHEALFRIERIVSGLDDCLKNCAAPEAQSGLECRSDAVSRVSASLALLRP
jgi:hypothetical protein